MRASSAVNCRRRGEVRAAGPGRGVGGCSGRGLAEGLQHTSSLLTRSLTKRAMSFSSSSLVSLDCTRKYTCPHMKAALKAGAIWTPSETAGALDSSEPASSAHEGASAFTPDERGARASGQRRLRPFSLGRNASSAACHPCCGCHQMIKKDPPSRGTEESADVLVCDLPPAVNY